MDLMRNGERLIRDWYRNGGKKALLVKGARQVGKTHSIRRVLNEEGADFLELNLIETPAAVDVLAGATTVDERSCSCRFFPVRTGTCRSF